MDDKLAALKKTSIFSGLSGKHLELLGRVTDRVNVKAGHMLIMQDQVMTHMSILIEGAAEVEIDGTHIADLGPGDVVGELSMIDDERASAKVTITEDSTLWHIARAGFIPLWEKNPDMSKPMLLAVVQRLRETNELVVS